MSLCCSEYLFEFGASMDTCVADCSQRLMCWLQCLAHPNIIIFMRDNLSQWNSKQCHWLILVYVSIHLYFGQRQKPFIIMSACK